MTEVIEIEKIQRLDVKPGETLVVTVRRMITRPEAEDIRDRIARHLPAGVDLLVKSGDIELSVIAVDATVPPPPPLRDNPSLGEYFGEDR